MVFLWGTGTHKFVVSFAPRVRVRHQPHDARGAGAFQFQSRRTSTETNGEAKADAVDLGDVGFVLLAGGTGSRMKATMPKQFLPLKGVPVLHYSLDLFLERLPTRAAEQGLR
jgi:hypothetical protein